MYGINGEKSPNFGRHHTNEEKEKMNERKLWKKKSNASSQYYGVHRVIRKKKYIYWMVRVFINGKREYIGMYKTEIEAAHIYDKCVIEHNFPNPLNFPEEYKK